MNELYHFELGIPANIINALVGKTYNGLTYSRHAQNACLTDRYGIINKPPFSVTLTQDNIIEVETDGNIIIKVVARLPYNSNYDVVIAFIPDRSFVKTVWLNSNRDLHYTLDESKYTKI